MTPLQAWLPRHLPGYAAIPGTSPPVLPSTGLCYPLWCWHLSQDTGGTPWARGRGPGLSCRGGHLWLGGGSHVPPLWPEGWAGGCGEEVVGWGGGVHGHPQHSILRDGGSHCYLHQHDCKWARGEEWTLAGGGEGGLPGNHWWWYSIQEEKAGGIFPRYLNVIMFCPMLMTMVT